MYSLGAVNITRKNYMLPKKTKKKKYEQISERMWFRGKCSLYTGSRQSRRHFASNWEIASCHVSAVIPIKEQVCSSLACKSLFTEMGARLEPLNWQINKHKEKWKHSSGKHLVPSSNYEGDALPTPATLSLQYRQWLQWWKSLLKISVF